MTTERSKTRQWLKGQLAGGGIVSGWPSSVRNSAEPPRNLAISTDVQKRRSGSRNGGFVENQPRLAVFTPDRHRVLEVAYRGLEVGLQCSIASDADPSYA